MAYLKQLCFDEFALAVLRGGEEVCRMAQDCGFTDERDMQENIAICLRFVVVSPDVKVPLAEALLGASEAGGLAACTNYLFAFSALCGDKRLQTEIEQAYNENQMPEVVMELVRGYGEVVLNRLKSVLVG